MGSPWRRFSPADGEHSGLGGAGATTPRPLRICLAASGGGHLRQLLDLEPAWSGYDHFFLTEDTALSRSVARGHRTITVPHLALGQTRLEAPLRVLGGTLRNLVLSARAIWRERPSVVISTGAGSVFFALLSARLLGAKVVAVETFARVTRPSIFGRITAPLAHHQVVQSEALLAFFPRARLFNPLRVLEAPSAAKEPLLLVTVGATLPFDRMVAMVADLKARGRITERVVVQTGTGGIAPSGLEAFETLPFETMQSLMRAATTVVCHGGTGSLITALRAGCRVVAVPRSAERGEHYDDHQAEITQALAARGLIAIAHTADELDRALQDVRRRPPMAATTDASRLVTHLKALLSGWDRAGPRAAAVPDPTQGAVPG
jgi:UDP-N-acetylglucosamine transferase subunit ALG13